MSEKINSEYLEQAVEHIKKIYKDLGHSPTAAKYDRISESQFKLRMLYKNNIKLNQLKEAAGVPIRKPGNKTGIHRGKNKPDIYCKAHKGKIAAVECMPGYRKEICENCEHKQKENPTALPDIPEEIEQQTKYDGLQRSKFMNGNDIYMTDIGVI